MNFGSQEIFKRVGKDVLGVRLDVLGIVIARVDSSEIRPPRTRPSPGRARAAAAARSAPSVRLPQLVVRAPTGRLGQGVVCIGDRLELCRCRLASGVVLWTGGDPVRVAQE